jgi:hypothetical protein
VGAASGAQWAPPNRAGPRRALATQRGGRTVPCPLCQPCLLAVGRPCPRRAAQWVSDPNNALELQVVPLPIGHGTHGDFCFFFSSPVYYPLRGTDASDSAPGEIRDFPAPREPAHADYQMMICSNNWPAKWFVTKPFPTSHWLCYQYLITSCSVLSPGPIPCRSRKHRQAEFWFFFLSFFDKPQSAVLEQGRGSSFLRLHSHTNAFDPLIQPFPDFPRPYLPDSKIIRLDIPITLFTYRVYYILILIEIRVSTLILKT